MKNINSNSILVFEYFTASGEKDKSIISEAESLIFSLIDDLKDFDLYWILDNSYKENIDIPPNITPIFLERDLYSWLNFNVKLFSRAIFIAAENDNNLFNITKILEDNEVMIYNSSSQAVRLCSNKYLTYKKLKNIVLQPKTFKIDEIDKCLVNKFILKPLNGVDCEDIIVTDKIDDDEFNDKIIIQEFIEGEDVSVSLISDGENVIPLSLNYQFIDFNNGKCEYLGGKIPYDSDLKDEIFNIAIKAVKSIGGIRGFVGVDFKINDDIYLLEINSRFATPYVGLKKISNINIGKSIINLVDGLISIDEINPILNGEISFKKENGILKIR